MEAKSIGMKTLCPYDENYISYYDNNDKTNFNTADGFSYHNGPEWFHCMTRGLLCLIKIINYLDIITDVINLTS